MSAAERAAYEERIRQTLERADAMNASLEERATLRRETGADLEERHQERPEQPKPVPSTKRAPEAPLEGDPWSGWNRWARTIADQRIAKELLPLASEIGAEFGKLERRVKDLEGRLEKSEAATVELLMELERRLAGLEQRAVMKLAKPKLVIDGG